MSTEIAPAAQSTTSAPAPSVTATSPIGGILPTPFQVQYWERIDTGTRDAHGNLPITWNPPLSEDGMAVPVAGWSVPASTEPWVPGTDRSSITVELLVSKGCPIRTLGRVKLPEYPAGMYEVIGDPRDYTHGPFAGPLGRGFGYVLTLSQING